MTETLEKNNALIREVAAERSKSLLWLAGSLGLLAVVVYLAKNKKS